MKTGNVKSDDAGDPYLECDDWSPWMWHASEEEFEQYMKSANSLMMRLERMPPAVRGNLKQISIRCPVKGCRLAIVYWLPRAPTPAEISDQRRMEELDRRSTIKNSVGDPVTLGAYKTGDYIYVGRTAGGTEVYDYVNFGFSAKQRDEARGCTCCRIVYWRAGCRHGTASLDRHYMMDMFMLSERVHNFYYTEEQAIAQLPDDLRPFWGKNVFHPAAKAWHPKKPTSRNGQASRSGRVSDVN